MHFALLLIYICIGALAGLSSGLLGIGGGLVTVPLLFLTFQVTGDVTDNLMQVSIGTSLGAMLFTAASSAWSHHKLKGIDWKIFRSLMPGIIFGSILGAFIADYLPSKTLQQFFGCSIALIGIYVVVFPKVKETHQSLWLTSLTTMGLLGIGIGTLSTLLGIGGGLITVPLLSFFGVKLRTAISTSAVNGFIIALIGGITFLSLGLKHEAFPGSIGFLYVPAFLTVGLVAALLAPVGAKLAYTLPVEIVKRIFGCLLIVAGTLLLFR